MDRVLVVGAGYGGVAACRAAADRLGRDGEVVLLDRRDHHLVRHESHRAIAAPDVAETLRIPGGRAAGRRASFRQTAVTEIDLDDGVVATRDSELPYDALVLAPGSVTAHYGVPGAETHGLPMEDLEDAARIRRAAIDACDRDGRIVVCGGGLTGVQVAGEVAALAEDRGADLDVRLVEALDRVLPDESSALRRRVTRLLRARGVVVDAGAPVVEVRDDAVVLDDGAPIDCDAAVWAAGIVPAPPPMVPGDAVGREGVRVDPTLRVEGAERVFAVGDAAAVDDADGRRAPATAWAALDQGRVAGRNAVRTLRDDEPSEAFRLDPPGTLVSVGRDAVAEVGGRVVGGTTARALKRGAAVRHVREVAGPLAGLRSAFKYL
jgi:NADH dehydrogenase